MIKQALISVSDKTGVLEFAKSLSAMGVNILSTGGTAKLLADNGVPVVTPPGAALSWIAAELLRPMTSCLCLGGVTLPITGAGRRHEAGAVPGWAPRGETPIE